jgi:S1-C subfamily serine protease
MGLFRTQGLLVADVDRGSPAATAELRRGMVVTSIDGQPVNDIVLAAKKLYARAKGDRVRLELIIPMQRGNFVRLNQGAVDVTLR